LSIKNVRSQGEEEFVRCGHFSDKGGGGSSDEESALFGAKNLGFFEIYGVSAGQKREGRLSLCGQFSDKRGKASIFRDFVRTSFMDGL